MIDKCGQRISELLVNPIKHKSIAIRRPVMSVSSHSSTSVSKPNLSSNSGQRSDSESSDDNVFHTDDDYLCDEPPKVRYGTIKVVLTIARGIYAGALFGSNHIIMVKLCEVKL